VTEHVTTSRGDTVGFDRRGRRWPGPERTARRGSHRGGTHPGCCSSSGCGQTGSQSGASGSPSSTRRGRRTRAFLYDIEVDEPHRGKGYGWALLTAAEEAARSRGVSALELNVFGGNATSIGLYESAGYIVVQQMRTRLT
jgi:GNAT superfamily N-acetyltransferase